MAALPLDFGSGDWEVSGWIRPASFANNYGAFLASANVTWGPGARFLLVYGASAPANQARIGLGGFDAVTGGGGYEAAGNPLVVSSVLTAGEWVYVRANRVAGVARLFVDEVLQGSSASTAAWTFANAGYGAWDGAAGYFDGAMTQWAYKTTGISTSPGTVPAEPSALTPYRVPADRPVVMESAFTTDGAVFDAGGGYGISPESSAVFSEGMLSGADMRFGGPDTLSGVVKRRVGEVDVTQYARVSLLRLRDKALARQVWSDPVTGEFSFAGIDATRRFFTLAEYPTNPDNPAAADYLRPVAGVSLKRGES